VGIIGILAYPKIEYSPTHLSGVIRENATHAKHNLD
jgi:hypothetical protein